MMRGSINEVSGEYLINKGLEDEGTQYDQSKLEDMQYMYSR